METYAYVSPKTFVVLALTHPTPIGARSCAYRDQTLDGLLYHFPPYPLRQGLSLSMELDVFRVSLPYPDAQHWSCRHM